MKYDSQIQKESLDGFIAGDRVCFERIYDCYRDRVYAYTFKITKSHELSEEVVQDVFIKIWNNRTKINPEFSFSSFIFRVAHNHTVNILKRLRYDKIAKENISKSVDSSVDDTDSKLILNEYLGIMKKAIDELPPKRKNIFNLSRVEGISHDKIADKMGISKNTVKSQLVKATKAIKLYFLHHADLAL
ncbi:RNA polymerase sigma-70 factor [soil metagenome]